MNSTFFWKLSNVYYLIEKSQLFNCTSEKGVVYGDMCCSRLSILMTGQQYIQAQAAHISMNRYHDKRILLTTVRDYSVPH